MYVPTHLSLFALARAEGQPIAGAPFYAEVVAPTPVPLPPVELDPRFDDRIEQQLRPLDPDAFAEEAARARIIAAIREAISRWLSQDSRDRLEADSGFAAQFFQNVIRAAKEANGGTLANLSSNLLGQAIEKAMREKAGRFELTLISPPAVETTKTSYPLGILATDHAGYLSFDLKRLPEDVYLSLIKAIDARRQDPEAVLDTSVWFYALAREDLRFDALGQGRFARDTVLTKLEFDMPFPLPPIARAAGFPAMQNPSLTDWRLSPASFAVTPHALIGDDDGCENLLPANLALQEYRFYQVVGLNDADGNLPADLQSKVQLGVLHEFRVVWYPLGHSLGQIRYSLPLAPGESINLAVIDWTRRDDAQRKEHTTLDEQIVHNEHRDRSISETVNAAVNEYQRGSSFMAGIASSSGLSGTLGKFGVATGLAGSLGGSTANSSGSRNIAVTTVQNISDNITQASAATRELQSTVVVHTNQSEKEAIETRTIVNYNHSHALTILYYEVLRYFRVVTEFVRRSPSVLVRMKTDWFTGEDEDINKNIRENRAALIAALLDPSLAGAFDAIDRIEHRRQLAIVTAPPAGAPAPPQPGPPGPNLRFFVFDMKTGGMYANEKGENINISATLWPVGHKLNNGGPFSPPGAFTQANVNNSFVGLLPAGAPPVPWGLIDMVDIGVDIFKGDETGTDVSFQHIKVTGIDVDGNELVLVDKSYADGHLILGNDAHIILPTRRPPPVPPPPPRPVEEIEDDVKRAQLVDHLDYHKAHYSRAILFAQNPTDRAAALAAAAVADRVENRPLEIIGEYVAYPCTDKAWSETVKRHLIDQPMDDIFDERLVALPTRGVFAEAKLGHCNASEEIDNTRFWDWQQSPIPHLAPEIAPIQGVTPQAQAQNLQSTPFPQSLVNIVNPPAAPDPTGLAAAMNVLGNPNIFRDMSGQAEVADLLKRLSDNTISIAQAANIARDIEAKQGGGRAGGSGATSPKVSGGGGGAPGIGGPRAAPTQPSAVSRDLQDLQHVLGNAQARGFTTPEQSQEIFTGAMKAAYTSDATLGFAVTNAAVAAATPATIVTLDPVRSDEIGQTLITYEHRDFTIFVPKNVIFSARDEIQNPKVHVFFVAAGVQGQIANDVLIHGLRGASNNSEWITIAVRGISGSARAISDADILGCLRSIGITTAPSALRLSGHSRGCDSMVASLGPKMITTLSLIDRVVFLDEAVEHAKDGRPNAGAVTLNRVAVVKQLGVPAEKIVSYEVGNRSFDSFANRSARIPGATYFELSPNCMAAIGCVRLIGDAIALRPNIASLVSANAAIVNQMSPFLMPARGGFSVMIAGGQDLNQYCQAHAAAITQVNSSLSNANASLLNFVNSHDLARFGGFQFSWGIAAHHFFVAEIVHEMTM